MQKNNSRYTSNGLYGSALLRVWANISNVSQGMMPYFLRQSYNTRTNSPYNAHKNPISRQYGR